MPKGKIRLTEGQGLSQGHMAGQQRAGVAWGDWAAVGALPTELVFVKFLLSFSYRKVQGPREGSGKGLWEGAYREGGEELPSENH